MTTNDLGRVPAAPGSHPSDQAPAGLGASRFDPSRGRYIRRTLSVYDKPPPALRVLADAMGVTTDEAREGLRALIEAGYGIAPRQPTNGMLAAYIEATTAPRHHEAVITAIGKARVRWQVMLAQGTEMALSLKHIPRRDSDRSGEAIETTEIGSTEGESAGLKGIAQPTPKGAP